MNSGTPSPSLKSIVTLEQNNSFLEDGSLEEFEVTVHEAAPSTFDEIISVNSVPWAWSDEPSDESVVNEFESPPSVHWSMAHTQISHSTELKNTSVEFGITPQKIMSPASSNSAKESSNQNRILKQETSGRKSMKSAMVANSSKEQKQVTVLKIDEMWKKELPLLRSSLPVRTSLLGRVEAKKKVGDKKKVKVVEFDISNEKSPTLDRTVKSVKPKQAGVVKVSGTSLSPMLIKKETVAPRKIIQLSPKPAVLPKTKSPVVKHGSPIVVSGGITTQSSKTASKVRKEEALKQFGASQAPKSSLYDNSGLNNRKLSLVKNRVDQKLMVVALKSAEQNHINTSSQQRPRVVSFRSSLASSSSKAVSNGNVSKEAQIDAGKWRTQFYDCKRIQRRTDNVCLEDKSLSPGNVPSITASSMSPLPHSALLSSSSKEDGDDSMLIIMDVSESRRSQIGEAKGRTFYDYKIIENRTKNVSLEGTSLSPKQMSFRRREEVSLQKENSDKSRLRFMKEESASEADNFEGEIGKSRESTTASSATPCLEHQNVQGNNAQSLFNDVIEETASKLVEIRKSKVKALVGAFESIISLQETN